MRRQKKLAVKVEKIEDKQNENWEIVVLISFLIIVLLVKTAQPFDYRLSHPYPYFYLASDAFFHIAYSQQVQDSGVYKNPPPYTTAGYSDVIAQNPPIWYILIAMFSYITGVETYDTSYLVTSLLFAFSSLIMYFAIRKHNTKIAIAALPFALGVYNFSFEISHAFGLWPFLLGAFYLTTIVWCVANLKREKIFILLGLFFRWRCAWAHIRAYIWSRFY